jgi:hypothetical protein
MKNSNTKQANKKVNNIVTNENEILTALNEATNEATNKITLEDVVTEKEKEKTAKREKAEQTKQLRKEKTQAKNDAIDFWMYQTRSKTAVKKFCQNNEAIILPYINKINALYDTNFDIGVINGTLENFAFIHEINVVDIDGQIVEDKKDIVSIKFYLDLLDRKAKYIDFLGSEFLKFSAKKTFNKCASATKTQIAKIKLINKAELSQAKYNSAVKTFDNTQTENLSNSELIYFLNKCFNDVKQPSQKKSEAKK